MMTTLTEAMHQNPPRDGRGLRITRLIVGYAAVASCIPYMTLKILWLSGHAVGGATPAGKAELLDTNHQVGNAVTLGLTLVAVVLALAFTHRWGQRIPAVLVLVPIWVATGLLAPITLGLPLGLLVQAMVGGSPIPVDNVSPAQDWVFAVVYSGFGVQTVTLLTAFVLYARVRWASLFRMRTHELGVGASRPRRVVLANAAAVGAVSYAAMHVVWAFTGQRLGGPAGFETATQKTFLVVTGLLVLAGAAGVLALVHRWGRGRRTGRLLVPLTVAWVGAGVTFASGFLGVSGFLGDGGNSVARFVGLAGALSGLLMGLAGLFVLIDRGGAVVDVEARKAVPASSF
jgi:hypothetical protein